VRLITKNDTSLVVGLIAGTVVIFQRPLRFVWEAALDVQDRYHVDLLPALTIFAGVFIFHEARKRQQAKAESRAAAIEAAQARVRAAELEQLMAFSQSLANSLDPTTLQQVMARHKDIQFASRGKSHVARQAQIHRLRHVVRELANRLPAELRADPVVQDLTEYGCGTLMHLVRLLSPRLDGEDHTKDIDFTRSGIRTRWQAGYEHGQRVLAEKPWECDVDMLQGIVIHESQE